jgi:hypothetical protein
MSVQVRNEDGPAVLHARAQPEQITIVHRLGCLVHCRTCRCQRLMTRCQSRRCSPRTAMAVAGVPLKLHLVSTGSSHGQRTRHPRRVGVGRGIPNLCSRFFVCGVGVTHR